MATKEELIALGLSEAEAERVVKREAKATAKNDSAVERAKKFVENNKPKLEHALERQAAWAAQVIDLTARLGKAEAVIAGTSTEEPEDEPLPAPDED